MTRFLARFKTFLLASGLMLFSVFMMFSKVPTESFSLRTMLFTASVSIEGIFVSMGVAVRGFFTSLEHIRTLESRLIEAEQKLQVYREDSFRYEQLQQENDHYRNLLGIQEQIPEKTYYAKVVFRDPTLLSDYIIIDKGRVEGIKQNMPVVSPSPEDRMVLVGKIVETGRHTSKVRLLTAKNFYVGVRLADTGYTGLLNGEGSWNQDALLNYIPVEADPALGEDVLTSGESDIYPSGILIGKVRGIGQNVMEEYFQILYIRPELNYARLSEVFVLGLENRYMTPVGGGRER
ncbi:MAG: rod shape-determining protein MreC [Brevinema sp.]